MARVRLIQRGSNNVLEVEDDSVDFWLERGFSREESKAPAKKATAKKASSSKTKK